MLIEVLGQMDSGANGALGPMASKRTGAEANCQLGTRQVGGRSNGHWVKWTPRQLVSKIRL